MKLNQGGLAHLPAAANHVDKPTRLGQPLGYNSGVRPLEWRRFFTHGTEYLYSIRREVKKLRVMVRSLSPEIENRESVFRDALDCQLEFQLSFWDASILAAAIAGGAGELWSEDFQDGRSYRGVRVVNPFRDLPE